MLAYLVHAMFAAFLVCLIYALNKQGEHQEMLVKGLELSRKAEAEAARHRLAIAMEAQQEATDKLRKLIEESHQAILHSQNLIRTGTRERGSMQVVPGHEGKKGL